MTTTMNHKETQIRTGNELRGFALMVSLTTRAADDPALAIAPLSQRVIEWVGARGSEATHLMLSVIDEGERYEEITRLVEERRRTDPGLDAALSQLHVADLICAAPSGQVISSRSLVQSHVELRVVLPPAMHDDGLVRVLGVFRDGEYEDMFAQCWDGERWAHDPHASLTAAECMTCPSVSDEFLAANAIPSAV